MITSLNIAEFLGKELHGESSIIVRPANLDECGLNDLVWVKSFTSERLNLIETRRPALAICDPETAKATTVSHIVSNCPRLDFICVLNYFFGVKREISIHLTAIIDEGAIIGNRVTIGAYARIGSQVSIGNDCIIGSGVSIEGRVRLGDRCVIKANSVLGGQGFGFEYDDDGNPVHFPHPGRIEIEDDVWIGACSTVEIGALGATKICQGVKVDDLVQVGHNVTVGKNTLIMANSVTCGGCTIGEQCWIAPNSVIKEKVKIGNRVTLGLGAVVLKDVEDDLTVVGVPAKPLRMKETL
jgi:UDP-3-O-[3-hydroxymyristoyl] glucosamine N-acyltransferase